MPVYNECFTLRCAVERVLAVPLEMEVLGVDDGSRDRSREILSAKRHLRIDEVGCAERKKIGWKDGLRALWCLLKYPLNEPSVAAGQMHLWNPSRVLLPKSGVLTAAIESLRRRNGNYTSNAKLFTFCVDARGSKVTAFLNSTIKNHMAT